MQKKKKKAAAAASLVLMFSVLLSACTGADKQEESVTAGQTETGTAAAGDVGEETIAETETASSESDLDRLKEWYHALEGDESAYYLWNKATGEGKLLQDGKYYTLDEEDLLVLYAPEGLDHWDLAFDVTVLNDYNIEGGVAYEISLEKNIVRWNSEVTGMSGTVKNFDFALISPVEKEDEKTMDQMTCFEWINEITRQAPEFIVINDETNERKELVNGETYQLKEGDIVTLFYDRGRFYKIDRTLPEIYIDPSDSRAFTILFWNTNTGKLEEKTEVTISLSNRYDPSDVAEISCTLLPSQ